MLLSSSGKILLDSTANHLSSLELFAGSSG